MSIYLPASRGHRAKARLRHEIRKLDPHRLISVSSAEQARGRRSTFSLGRLTTPVKLSRLAGSRFPGHDEKIIDRFPELQRSITRQIRAALPPLTLGILALGLAHFLGDNTGVSTAILLSLGRVPFMREEQPWSPGPEELAAASSHYTSVRDTLGPIGFRDALTWLVDFAGQQSPAATWNAVGQIIERLEPFPRTADSFLSALALMAHREDPLNQILLHERAGYIAARSGFTSAAINHFQEALRLSLQYPNPTLELLLNQVRMQEALGMSYLTGIDGKRLQPAKARVHFHAALATEADIAAELKKNYEVDDPQWPQHLHRQIRLQQKVAEAYLVLGQTTKALDYYEHALDAARECWRSIVEELEQLVLLLQAQEDRLGAWAATQQSSHHALPALQLDLLSLWHLQSDPKQSLKYLNRAAKKALEQGQQTRAVQYHLAMAQIYNGLGNPSAAGRPLLKAAKAYGYGSGSRPHDPTYQAIRTLWAISRVEAKLKLVQPRAHQLRREDPKFRVAQDASDAEYTANFRYTKQLALLADAYKSFDAKVLQPDPPDQPD